MRFLPLVLFLFAVSASAAGPVFPTGWRSPTDNDLKDVWRDKCPNRCAWVAGDFNGDNLVEGAFLAVHEKRNVFGLLAFIYTAPGKARWFVLDEIHDLSWVTVMGVELYAPGTYRVMCGDSDKHCDRDGKKPLRIERPAISYFKSESASSIIYWQQRKQRFVRVWESD